MNRVQKHWHHKHDSCWLEAHTLLHWPFAWKKGTWCHVVYSVVWIIRHSWDGWCVTASSPKPLLFLNALFCMMQHLAQLTQHSHTCSPSFQQQTCCETRTWLPSLTRDRWVWLPFTPKNCWGTRVHTHSHTIQPSTPQPLFLPLFQPTWIIHHL